MKKRYEYRLREPYANPQGRGAPPAVYRRSVESRMIIERDVAVVLRDGVRLFVDIYRPEDEQPAAPLIGWGPYGKHVPNEPLRFPHAGWNAEHMSAMTPFEGPDPLYWVPRGYAVLTVNPRGTWYSQGTAT
jgi:predicted acyl esterase